MRLLTLLIGGALMLWRLWRWFRNVPEVDWDLPFEKEPRTWQPTVTV